MFRTATDSATIVLLSIARAAPCAAPPPARL